MLSVWKHIHRLHCRQSVFCIQQGQIPCLCGRVATNVNNTFRLGKENDIYHILMHTCTRRIGDYNIRTTVLVDKVLR